MFTLSLSSLYLKVLLLFYTVLFNSKEHSASCTDACERRTIYHELTAQAKVLTNMHELLKYFCYLVLNVLILGLQNEILYMTIFLFSC